MKVACLQLNSGPEIANNLDRAEALIRAAVKEGAQFVLTPECSDMIEMNRERLWAKLVPEEDHPGPPRFAKLAKELGIWLLAGSFLVRASRDKGANRSFLFSPKGKLVARYDKIHMFDVQVGDGQSYRESATYRPGTKAVLAKLPWGPVGLTICYDMRFAKLYRDLAQAGAAAMTAPSAFTQVTGKAHWHALLRTRAIETGSYLLAPAQTGKHSNGRRTFGHALIVDPWGQVLGDAGTKVGYIMAELDMDAVTAARGRIPSLGLDRRWQKP